ncbi:MULTISPECIES: hypothetical protein [Streptomyces]|uniref:Extradiol ring-cleavage dioxygenase class III enzyme subunit B domain-containing protein n=1 Tax=Streptomyces cacaoi TaxID=1898 RepID=A0A4Y3QVN1_STRCI|nr:MULTISPECIES: hypothetical protein [Streptomyces]NNG83392.1 hypothetical protein [Streptomyces cacaoi]GEB49272.1 hypothetical protein SCA03_18230 [Streptomyces cacaoi]
MAQIVAAAGVPHTPVFPALARGGTEQGHDIAARYRAVETVVAGSDADVVVILSCDHINTFFLDAWPTFAVVGADRVRGPNDEVPGVSAVELRVAGKLGAQLHERLVLQEFDPVLSRAATVDHSIVVPLHFLNPHGVPIVPVYINGMVGPLPTAHRCRRLGAAVRRALEDLPARRVAVVASGSFSLDVGSPRIDPDRMYGVPAPEWAATAVSHLRHGRLDRLSQEATAEQIAAAGSVSGEILPWIVMAEICRDLSVSVMDHREGEGHAFAAWQ